MVSTGPAAVHTVLYSVSKIFIYADYTIAIRFMATAISRARKQISTSKISCSPTLAQMGALTAPEISATNSLARPTHIAILERPLPRWR